MIYLDCRDCKHKTHVIPTHIDTTQNSGYTRMIYNCTSKHCGKVQLVDIRDDIYYKCINDPNKHFVNYKIQNYNNNLQEYLRK